MMLREAAPAAAGWSPSLVSICQSSRTPNCSHWVGCRGTDARAASGFSISLSWSWDWEEDVSSGESSFPSGGNPEQHQLPWWPPSSSSEGTLPTPEGLRELCQILFLSGGAWWGLCLQRSPALCPPRGCRGACSLWQEAELGAVSRPGIAAVLCSCHMKALGSVFLHAYLPRWQMY